MGFFNWIGSRPKRLADYGKKVLGTEEIKKNADYIVDMASSLNVKSDRHETFENAYARLGLTEDRLKETYKYYMDRFNMFIAFFGLGLVMTGYFLISGAPLSSLATLAFMLICLAQMFNASFRMLQIRKRELLSVMEWLKRKEEWWPKEYKPRKQNKGMTRSSTKNREER